MRFDLTIVYPTNRANPRIEWFFDSLHRELQGDWNGLQVIVVTPSASISRLPHILCVAPKPTPWQGPHRQTQVDWFAAANARNTGICHARTKWIAFVDDLSVLMPGWIQCVSEAMHYSTTITAGSYRKVKELVVNHGDVVCFADYPAGVDNRLSRARAGQASACGPEWLYGCSMAGPLEAFLQVNGFDERCDGLGSEDYITGINLGKLGWSLRFDPRMMTYEADDLHEADGFFIRRDFGVSPNDKSHAILSLARNGNGISPVDFGGMDLRGLRENILSGGSFPLPPSDFREWYTGRLLKDL